MSDAESKIVEHYATNGLLARLEAALRGYQNGSLIPIEVVARKR